MKKIGMTYDVRDHYLDLGYDLVETAEFDYPETIDAIESVLVGKGCAVDRIGTVRDLSRRLVAGDSWDLVFNIAVGMHGDAREAQVPALLDAWEIPYAFSGPLAGALCLDKAMAKRVLRDSGLPTPDFFVVENLSDISNVDLEFPLMTKPVREGNSKGVSPASCVRSERALRDNCRELLQRFRQPVLVEHFLPGREVTVGIIGTGEAAIAVAVMEKLLGDEPVYYKYDVGFPNRLLDDPEAHSAAEMAVSAWRTLGCRDGGRVDLRSDAHGRPHILDINPFPGLRAGYADLPELCKLAGMSYTDMIWGIVDSAMQRKAAELRTGRSFPDVMDEPA